MPERPGPKRVEAIRSTEHRVNLRPASGILCQSLDMFLFCGIFLGVAMLPGLMGYHRSLPELLWAGLSVRNVVVVAMCLGTWRVVLLSVGIYDLGRSRSMADYVFRCLIGLNGCVVVIGLIDLVLQVGTDVWRFMEIYWLCCLVAMTVVRMGLLWPSHQRTRGSRLE